MIQNETADYSCGIVAPKIRFLSITNNCICKKMPISTRHHSVVMVCFQYTTLPSIFDWHMSCDGEFDLIISICDLEARSSSGAELDDELDDELVEFVEQDLEEDSDDSAADVTQFKLILFLFFCIWRLLSSSSFSFWWLLSVQSDSSMFGGSIWWCLPISNFFLCLLASVQYDSNTTFRSNRSVAHTETLTTITSGTSSVTFKWSTCLDIPARLVMPFFNHGVNLFRIRNEVQQKNATQTQHKHRKKQKNTN